MYQRTLNAVVEFEGRGVHANVPVTLKLRPASVGSGLTFVRSDLQDQNTITASIEGVVDTRACTVVANSNQTTLATVEHLIAALAGLNLTNCIIEVSGPEVPILDGCSNDFLEAIARAGGAKDQSEQLKKMIVRNTVRIEEEGRWIEIAPADNDQASYHMTVDFNGREGLQSYKANYIHSEENFKSEIAPARTYGFYADADKLRSLGLALGSSLDNSVVFQDGNPMNKDGLRFDNEMARHKILDAIGDFFLCGYPLVAKVTGYNSGHGLNNQIMRKLLSDSQNYQLV